TASEEKTRHQASVLLSVLTPIVKAWSSDHGLKANELAIQVLGGYGYTRDFPLERLYRDNRLNPIHEGTNGIQALDLLGRKVIADKGAAPRLLLREILRDCDRALELAETAAHAERLKAACQTVTMTTAGLTAIAVEGHADAYLANA